MRLLLTLTFFFNIYSALACRPIAPKEINLAIDINKGIQKFYTSKRLLDNRPSVSVNNCRDTALAKKFVMVGLGLENLVLTNEVMGFNFTPQEETVECRMENNPFEVQETADQRFKENQAKRDFFDRCVVVQVTELNENIGIRYPEKQPGCKVTKKSKWSVDFSGPYCFFQPYPESNISIHLDVLPNCRKKKSLTSEIVTLSDYNAVLNTYLAGDATGFSADLTATSTTPVRLSYNPVEELMGVSDDFGSDRPTWPTTWVGGDLFFGELRVTTPSNNYNEILLPLAVNTKCEKKCKGNLCGSPCDYAQPIVGEFTLYEVINGKREFLKLWHDGSVAPARYQGLLYGMGVSVPKGVLEADKKYQIEAIFREPDLDFAYFSGRIDRALRLQRNYIGPLSRTGQINMIPQISLIAKPGEVPEVPVIRNLSFDNSNLNGLSRALATWQSKLDNAFWPPYFEDVCAVGGNCEKSGKAYVQLTLDFTLEETEKGLSPIVLKGQRKSNIVANKTWKAENTPKVSCGAFSDDRDDSDNDFDWGDIL